MQFYTGVITNITHEHLDYHGTFEKYKAAKMKLLAMSKHPIYSYEKSKLKITNPKLAGDYNLYNLGAATAVAKLFGVENMCHLWREALAECQDGWKRFPINWALER